MITIPRKPIARQYDAFGRQNFTRAIALLLLIHICYDVWIAAPYYKNGYIVPLKNLHNLRFGMDAMSGRYQEHHIWTTQSNSSLQTQESSLTPARVKDILLDFNHLIAYVHSLDTVFVNMPKTGSTTFWQLMFLGLSGRIWERERCGDIHNHTSFCWNPYLTDVRYMSLNEQHRVLASSSTRRVAIQRDPFSRLISGYKDKIGCDTNDRSPLLDYAHRLRRNANAPPGPGCMNISEFANTLETIRTHIGQPGYLKSWRYIDRHFAPQNYFADEIRYHALFDVADLSNQTRLAHILDKLPYGNLSKKANVHSVKSKTVTIMMDDKTAQKLYNYAQLAVPVSPESIVRQTMETT